MFQRTFGVSSLQQKDEDDFRKLASAVYLQVSTISQALIFVTRARSWSFVERPGLLLVAAFVIAQLVSELMLIFLGLQTHSLSFLLIQLLLLVLRLPHWLLSMQTGVLLRLRVLAGDGLVSFGSTTSSSIFHLILSSSSSDMLWVGELGIL